MSGGAYVPIPEWLGSAKEAFVAIMGLRRFSSKQSIENAKDKFRLFEREAYAKHVDLSLARAEIKNFIKKFPNIAREVVSEEDTKQFEKSIGVIHGTIYPTANR